LDETTIHVDTILYLSLYYLVNDLVHLPNQTTKERSKTGWKCRKSHLKGCLMRP